MRSHCWTVRSAIPLTALYALLLTGQPQAQPLSGEALLKSLRQGGHVIVMRHTSSPRQAPDKQTANADNSNFERQLDAAGRSGATAMGEAFRRLRIPVGVVLSSPTYRALETVRYAKFGNPQTHPELGDGGQSMQAGTEAQATWLRQKAGQFPRGTNTLIVTHQPNIAGAFAQLAADVADGEALVFGPDGKGGSALVARVKIEDWPRM